MISRLPAWGWLGAAGLSLVAGMVNVVGFLGFEQQAVAHLTGTTSLLGVAVAKGEFRVASGLLLPIASFVAGAILSGVIVQDRTLRMGRCYGVALAIEAALLAAAVPLFEAQHTAAAALAAMACGLQNAVTATFSGALVRTSHLTGMFTDLGVFLGHRLRGIAVDPRRLWLCLLVIGSFALGGVGGSALFPQLGYRALLLPAALTGFTAVTYLTYRCWRGPANTTGAS
ncbi:MAG TPA: YoaK family protein [Lysobacter sp.]